MEELGSPDSPSYDDNLPSQPSIHPELLPALTDSIALNIAPNDLDVTENADHQVSSQDVDMPAFSEPAISPDILSHLANLTPGITAELKRMLDENKKRDIIVAQMKDLMDWESLNEEARAFLPEDFVNSLGIWAINSMQPEVIRNCILEQNKKELEFHKKRDDLVQEHQKEIWGIKRRHQEAAAECDQKNMPHRKPLVLKKNEEEFNKLLFRQKEDLIALDKKIVTAIDGLLTVQQRKLQEIGIPGMKETMEPGDILRQMIVMDMMSKLAGVDVEIIPR